MTTYFTSDQHIGHANIVHKLGPGRPFHNLTHMHQTIKNNWFEIVQPDDIVYVMGDIAMGNIEESILFFKDLPGVKKFMPGNHDKIGKTQSNNYNQKFISLYEEVGFEVVEENITIEIEVPYGTQTVLLSHYPYGEKHVRESAEPHKDKFRKVRPVNNGLPLIHGHTHSQDRLDEHEPLQFHIGVDANNFTPVNQTEIVEWLETLHAQKLI